MIAKDAKILVETLNKICYTGGDWKAKMNHSEALNAAIDAPGNIAIRAIGSMLSSGNEDDRETARLYIKSAVFDAMEEIADWYDTTGFNLVYDDEA